MCVIHGELIIFIDSRQKEHFPYILPSVTDQLLCQIFQLSSEIILFSPQPEKKYSFHVLSLSYLSFSGRQL